MATQLEGNITLGGNDYAGDTVAFILRGTRETTQTPGTFADSDGTSTPGSRQYEVTVRVRQDETDSANVFAEIWAAFLTDDAELAFTANPTTGATSATNPEFSGTLIINNVEAMGTVGEDKMVEYTFPANGVTMATS